MFHLRYIVSELHRRKGRTVLTALGLGVGVGLVVAVTALSAGLDEAQSEVLEPLTGVGTDMSVSRPIVVEQEEGDDGETGFEAGPGAQLSQAEQKQLERENEIDQQRLVGENEANCPDRGARFQRSLHRGPTLVTNDLGPWALWM